MLETDKAELLHRTPKIITTPITWVPQTGNRFRLEVKVLAPDLEEVLRLVGNIGNRTHSFVLLYQNYPIRKYTKHFRHKSHTTGEVFSKPHKHIWESESEDDKAYVPSDIDPSSEINDQFVAFLKEENITPQSGYQRVMVNLP